MEVYNMILSDQELLNLIKQKNLIEDYNEGNLQSASYDITASNRIQIFNRIQGILDLRNKKLLALANKEVDIDNGYCIMPNEYLLIKTKEIFHMPPNIAGHIRPRTTYTRIGLILSGQHLNPTFAGHLYLGILNASPNAIQIFPGLIIGQAIFEKLEGNVTSSLLYENKTNAKYQNEDDFITPKVEELNSEKSEVMRAYKKILDDLKK